jgi:hypothetical protein
MAVLDPAFAEGVKKTAQGTVRTAANISKKQPWVPVGIAAFHYGKKAGKATQSANQSAYGDTYSKGRAANKHPYAGGY